MNMVKPESDRFALLLVTGVLVTSTFLQKIAMPLGSGSVVFMALPLLLALCFLGWIKNRLEFAARPAAMLLIMAAGLLASQILGGHDFALTSLLMLLFTHFAYSMRLKPGLVEPNAALLVYQKICVILAVLGIVQFALQFVIGRDWAFFIDTKIPDILIVPGFNNLNELRYGSDILKANAFFMLEPSHLSQFLAMACVAEIAVFRNWLRLGVLLAGIISTFSGTGLLLLLVLTPVYLVHKRHFIVLLLGFIALATAGLWAPALGLSAIYDRVFEFTSTQSSGYARFLGIFQILQHNVLPDTQTLFFGKGAGSTTDVIKDTGFDYLAHNPSWGKLMYEYGLLGLVCYGAFFFTLLARANISVYMRAALALQFLFLGEYLLPPTTHGLLIALLAWPQPQHPKGSAPS